MVCIIELVMSALSKVLNANSPLYKSAGIGKYIISKYTKKAKLLQAGIKLQITWQAACLCPVTSNESPPGAMKEVL